MFGGALGGPIRKNRLFFFTDYQGTRLVNGVSSGVIHVPSVAERSGDFSDISATGYPALTVWTSRDPTAANESGGVP
jgi:hypothetical protein